MTYKSKILIKMNLEETDAEKFEVVKRFMGPIQNTEVIKALISEKCNEIRLLEEKQRKQRIDEAKAMEWLEKGEYRCCM